MATSRTPILFVLTLTVLFPMANSQTFDSFWFVQQWPPGVCAFQPVPCVQPNLESFTIHGLWPQKGRTSATGCHGTDFTYDKISLLESPLNATWPDVIGGNQKQFWRHEWNKHGKCSEKTFRQSTYFWISIHMRNRFRLLYTLGVAGIVPNNGTKEKIQVQKAIKQSFRTEPILRCTTPSKRPTSPSVVIARLAEIVMCFADNGITLINCDATKSTCPKKFIF
ncbi:ribonuclease MC-like [Momordica charantia]|uniref:Ribonuclease MC-like n=1 Tax=Momordica charantia TaxID=3673 RepID=A0A6J1E0T7_MOMCH|nr:ribonuclease MC-like [Momordica charantia]